MRLLVGLAVVAACQPGAPARPAATPTPATPTPAAPTYDGVTTCGRGVAAPPVLGFQRDVRGSLDRDIIRRPIRAHAAQFAACYERLLATAPRARGRVVATFELAADGTVEHAEIRGFERHLDECFCAEVLRLAFPRFGSATLGKVVVSYPFALAPTSP